ncbi:hypothetical protein [Neiella marina]|uniref:hypothetical protein n=1 Tax=Neiella marina TaxID=508461 RepID=UPI000B3C078A|nr:hypothetical protein [Neiella marina]
MRSIQMLGFLSTLGGIAICWFVLSDVGPETSDAAGAAAGLVILLAVGMFKCAAIVLIPSSIALLWPAVRQRTYFKGKFWFAMWGINGLFSIVYLFAGAYVFYVWLNLT